MLENERSFLVKNMPVLAGVQSDMIDQHYLDGTTEPLRLRRRGSVYELAKKIAITPGDLSRVDEKKLTLDHVQYQSLRPAFERSVSKYRYYMPLGQGLVAELDVFEGDLAGLVMVEVEFPDEKSRSSFEPPDWFGREVSQEIWSSNAFLAGKKFTDIEHFLVG